MTDILLEMPAVRSWAYGAVGLENINWFLEHRLYTGSKATKME